MPVKFQFRERKSGEVVDVTRIDELICAEMGIECDPERYSRAFDSVTNSGIAVLDLHSKGEVTKDDFEEALARQSRPLPDNTVKLLRKYLYDEYIFSAWR